MTDLMAGIREQAKKNPHHIVLPETEDERVIEAAVAIQRERIAKLLLIGEPQKIAEELIRRGGRDTDFVIRHPQGDAGRAELVETYYQQRRAKGMTRREADEELQDAVYFGAMLLKAGQADGLVSGSLSPTAKVLRAALRCLGPARGIKTVSSYTVIISPLKELGVNGVFLFADTGVIPEPTAEQLAEIAIATANNCRIILQAEPRVAMISFSTKGSAKHPSVAKVVEATRLAKLAMPDLLIDGEMQVDAAIIESVGRRKAPDSPVAGRTNVLVFPDLSCANSAYKLAERLGGAQAIGPVLQGIAKQVNDLSRGCSVQDIVDLVALTSVQVQQMGAGF